MNAPITAAGFALLLALSARAVSAQSTPIAGTWSIEPAATPGTIQFEIRTKDDGNFHVSSSFDSSTQALGLSTAQLQSRGNHVVFTLAREAGSFACEGWLSDGKGGGTFTFAPSANYLVNMRSRGYDSISAHDQMVAALLDITSGYVDAIAAAGYPHLPFDKLVAFRALRIDAAYVRAMRAAFPSSGGDVQQIIALRALRVTDSYVTEMRNAGFAIETAQEAVKLRALRIDAAYVRDMTAVGYPNLSSEQFVQLRALGIDATYVKRVKAHGFPHPTVEQLIRLKSMNVI